MSGSKKWLYIYNGNEAGPITSDALDKLISQGFITPATLIWREGMKDWQPYHLGRHAKLNEEASNKAQSVFDQASTFNFDFSDRVEVTEECTDKKIPIKDDPETLVEEDVSESILKEEASKADQSSSQRASLRKKVTPPQKKSAKEIKVARLWYFLVWFAMSLISFGLLITLADLVIGKWVSSSALSIVILTAYCFQFSFADSFMMRKPTSATKAVALIIASLSGGLGILGVFFLMLGPADQFDGNVSQWSSSLSNYWERMLFYLGLIAGSIWAIYTVVNSTKLRREWIKSKEIHDSSQPEIIFNRINDKKIWDAINQESATSIGVDGFGYFLLLFSALWGVFTLSHLWWIPLILFCLAVILEHLAAMLFGVPNKNELQYYNPIGHFINVAFCLLTIPVSLGFLIYWWLF